MSEQLEMLLAGYAMITGMIAFIALIATLGAWADNERQYLRNTSRAFFLSPLWPLAIVAGVLFLAGWLGVQAFSPRREGEE